VENDASQWQFLNVSTGTLECPRNEGTYYIQNRNSGLYLSVEKSSTEDGGVIRQYDYPWMQSAQWTVHLENDGHIMTNVHSGKILNVKGNSEDEGANLIQSSLSGSLKSMWIFDEADVVDHVHTGENWPGSPAGSVCVQGDFRNLTADELVEASTPLKQSRFGCM